MGNLQKTAWAPFARLLCATVIFLMCFGFFTLLKGTGALGETGDVVVVSKSAGGVSGDFGSSDPYMTPDGRYVAFGSVATNLVSTPPPEGVQAVYWKDLSTGAIKLVSADAAGTPAQLDSFVGGISHDGRYVIIFSYEADMISPPAAPGTCWVFRKDMVTEAVVLVSSSSAGVAGDDMNWFPSINADGTMVAFMSDSGNLVTSPPAGPNIYLKNLSTGNTSLLSCSQGGDPGDEASTFPKINASGRYVSFISSSSNLVTPAPAGDYNQVYRKDTQTGEVVLVSSKVTGAAGDDHSDPAVLDPEGRFAVFPSSAGNLIDSGVPAGVREIYLKDIETGSIEIVSSSEEGDAGNGNSDEPVVSSGGRYVSFESASDNLLSPAPSGTYFQVYRKDTYTGDIVMVSTSKSGDYGDDASAQSSITTDGKYVAFGSGADNLISPVPPADEVYRKELPIPPTTWYLAEGTNAWGFSTYISIENPNDEELTVRLTYMDPNPAATGDGVVGTRNVTLPPLSQTCVSSEPDIGEVDFSTKVECLEGEVIAVDRTMFWEGAGLSPDQAGYHNSIGTMEASNTWYLPEGSSNWGFETWTLILNPNSNAATVDLTYMTESGPIVKQKTVPANSRMTFNMETDIGVNDASVEVTSDLPVVAERSMYRNNRRGGSCSIGAVSPATDFYLAEGATGHSVGFTTYILVQNPTNKNNDVTVTYHTQDGQVDGPTFTMEPKSRKTVCINDQLAPGTNVSTTVHGSEPLVAERAMYWDNGTGQAFHASIGLDAPHMSFYMPDGQVSDGFETWTLVQNPNQGAVKVIITYLPQNGGTPVAVIEEIPAKSRSTFNMTDFAETARASIMVESLDGARPVMVERAMYTNNMGAGTDTVGGHSRI